MSNTLSQGRRQDKRPVDHNAGIYLAIGSSVANWANNESVFLALLQAVIGGERLAANVIWYSQRTTKARLDLLLRLCRAKLKDEVLLQDIEKGAAQFRGFTRVRNRYCHGLYAYNVDGRLDRIETVSVADDGEPLRPLKKPFNRATLNELADTITKLAALNRDLWALVSRLGIALGVQTPPVPPVPPVPSLPDRT